jgi:hypothetical protein
VVAERRLSFAANPNRIATESSRPRAKPGVAANVQSKPKEIGHHLIPLLTGWVDDSGQWSVVSELKTDLVVPSVLTTDH